MAEKPKIRFKPFIDPIGKDGNALSVVAQMAESYRGAIEFARNEGSHDEKEQLQIQWEYVEKVWFKRSYNDILNLLLDFCEIMDPDEIYDCPYLEV